MGRFRGLASWASRSLLVVLVVGLLTIPALSASGQLPQPLNDLFSFGQGDGETPEPVATEQRAEPPFVATPRAECGPGARPEPGIQGRVPAGSAAEGFVCNVSLIGRHGRSGGFKVHRYVDESGRECGYYDTALLFPVNALKLSGDSLGVAVLDMSDPSRPRQTATLTEAPMLSPHESLALNPRRGLLAAVLGNPSTAPGLVSIYDISEDCRQPVLQSSAPVARLGHESRFSVDGNTFYATSTATESISAIDVSDPKQMRSLWHGKITSHGMSLSDDGNRAYLADPGGELVVLDTSEIQARKPDPQTREISRLTWRAASIPQNAIPFTRDGKPYLLEIDEYTAGTTGSGSSDDVGAARIIDISAEVRPRVVANLRLQVNQPEDHAAASEDPGADSPVQGYAAHYCDVPTPVDPQVVACSFIASGLRVFDISDLSRLKEIAYFVAPTQARAENRSDGSNFAMSKPAIVAERREVWYSDGTSGFYVVRVAESVWPGAADGGEETAPVRRRRSRDRGSGRRQQADDRGARADRDSSVESDGDGSVQAFEAGAGGGSGGDLAFTGLGLGALLGGGLVLVLGGLMLRRRAAPPSGG